MKTLEKIMDKIIQYSPEIKVPLRKIPLVERIANTTLVLLIFMILSEITLPSIDPARISKTRAIEYIMGTAKGTIFTMGIYPIIMGGFLIQLLVLFKLINVNTKNPKELDKLEKIKHLTTIFFIILMAISQAFQYSYPTIPAITFSFIMFTIGGFLIMLMVDYIDKYGFYSGISLIILLRASKSVFMYLFNPISDPDYGLVTKLVYAMMGKEPFTGYIKDMTYLIIPILGTIGVTLLLIYLHSSKVTIARQTPNTKLKRILPKREHSLLFLSVVPLILGTMVMEALRVFIVAISNIITQLGHPIGNTIIQKTNYWLTPPYGWWNFSLNPLRAITYYTLLFTITYLITYIYLFYSNMTPSRIHLILKYYEPNRRKGLLIPRARKVMRILIPISVGLIILISFLGNYLMVASGGTGLVLSVSIALQMHDTFKQMLKRETTKLSTWEFFITALKKIPSIV